MDKLAPAIAKFVIKKLALPFQVLRRDYRLICCIDFLPETGTLTEAAYAKAAGYGISRAELDEFAATLLESSL